jgi:hypothetical protein
MIEATVSGLILLAVGAIGWIAYHHPTAYKKILSPLSWLLSIVLVTLNVFYVGASWMFYKVVRFVAVDARTDADAEFAPLGNVLFWAFIIWLVVQIYLIFLRALPELLKNSKPQEPEQK